MQRALLSKELPEQILGGLEVQRRELLKLLARGRTEEDD